MALDDAHAGLLPCGTLLEDLIAQVTEGTRPLDQAHQAACRYCQAALDAIGEAWEGFQSVARSAVAVPEDLAERIVTRIRSLARATGEGVVITAEHGETRIADSVLARLARQSALAVPGVRLATVLRTEEDPEQLGSVVVALRLVVALWTPIEWVADTVRAGVIRELEAQTGTAVARVDVAVEDIVLDPSGSS